MKIQEIAELINARIICGAEHAQTEIRYAFASDLMSDVLTVKKDAMALITGLSNLQTIRTAEMSDIHCVILVRCKKGTPEMVELALENNIVVIECNYTMFKTSGILFNAGINPVY
jgi:hypothetical protein